MFNNIMLVVNIVFSYLTWVFLLWIFSDKIKNHLIFVILILLIYMIPVGYYIVMFNAMESITGPLISIIMLMLYAIKKR
ncbi:MAG: hypothetical protein QXE81_05670, partial [Desulfurococcaceae archaeon]